MFSTGAALIALAVLVGASAQRSGATEGRGPYELVTDWWLVRGQDGDITFLAWDPGGTGKFADSLVLRLGPAINATRRGSARWRLDRKAGKLIIEGVRGASIAYRHRNEDRDQPIRLQPGGSVGELVHNSRDGLCYVAIMTPTWTEKDSAVTVQVRRGGPKGKIVARHRAERVFDNAWTGFAIPPQPAGDYFIELVEPKGAVGAWAKGGNPFPGGEAFVNGVRQDDIDLCLTLAWGIEVAGRVTIAVEAPDRLRYAFQPTGAEKVGVPLALTHRWEADGYDVSPLTTPFRAYVTDDFQYLPAHQLKRRARPEIGLHPGRWLGLLGTTSVDLKLETVRGAVNIELRPKRLTLGLPTGAVTIAATEDGERWLQRLPRFLMPDQPFARDWNTFLYERAFSYHPIKTTQMADWFEWRARILYWMNVPGLFEAELPYLLFYRMTDDGYVYTWGEREEWPFPDNDKYDARHFTTNSNYVLACWRAFCWTGDIEFLRRAMPRVRRAMQWQLDYCRGAEGLFIDNSPDHDGTRRGVHSNYWDDIPFGYKSAYENIYFYASLLAMAELEEAAAKLLGPSGSQASARPASLVRPPSYYRELARRVHRNYDDTFWAGDHYIACVDITGKRHDYGITYVNLEAFAYGLGDAEKARKFYRWLETVKTESGKADMYAFEFAPRVNAWDLSKTWWYLEGKDIIKPQPWGKHLENGGAILYTSHFDLVARAKYLGPDNALRRAKAILDRWGLPDHLSGGFPLSAGEHSGWGVGTDIPFPESGLVPVSPLYCFLGVEAHVDGLHIRPNLPSRWSWLKVTGLRWRGLVMDVSAGREPHGYRVGVVVRSPKANAAERVWHIRAGEEVVLRRPLRGKFPPTPMQRCPLDAYWIWSPGKSREPDSRCLARREFVVEAEVKKAVLWVAVDNEAQMSIDGRPIASWAGWTPAGAWDVARFLRPGRHVIAIAARNGDGPAGLLARLEVTYADGSTLVIGTDERWRVAESAEEGWTRPGFDDTSWRKAERLGPWRMAPWGVIEVGQVQEVE